jgi:GT2 family glycosyltransferase
MFIPLALLVGRTSVIVVSYGHREVIGPCVRALEQAALPPGTRLLLVDNDSPDGTAAYIREQLLTADGRRTRGGLPALLFANATNLGFAGGNNLAIARALADGDEFVYLLNPDTEVEPDFLIEALAVARRDPDVAFVQSLLLRHDDPALLNSWGNAMHFLGFGYAAGDGRALADPEVVARLGGPRAIAFPSGAGMLARADSLRALGAFSDELFLYCEDMELGWRAHLHGLQVLVAPASRVRHRYQFARHARKYYYLERNRLLVLAWCYRRRTLLLLAPALAATELGSWALAVRGGWWRDKGAAWAYLLAPTRWPALRANRRRVQALRRASDRDASALFTGEIVFPALRPWLLTRVANPLLSAYWRGARRLMRW